MRRVWPRADTRRLLHHWQVRCLKEYRKSGELAERLQAYVLRVMPVHRITAAGGNGSFFPCPIDSNWTKSVHAR